MATVDITRTEHMDVCTRAGFLQLDSKSNLRMAHANCVVHVLCYRQACGVDYSPGALQCLQPDGSSVQQLGFAQSGHKSERFHQLAGWD